LQVAAKTSEGETVDDSCMNTSSTDHRADRPRLSGRIRRLGRALEPLSNRVAGSRWFPLWAILHHIGRTSGKPYATTVVALATPEGFIVPLPFGDATQWARNLLAAGAGSIRSAGKDHAIGEPRIVDLDEAAPYLPPPIRFMARRLGLRQWVLVRRLRPRG
jgi:deazaflavin-dependent oxidoreductase (nitroreductase family)